MTTRPYELLARFDKDGKVAGVHVRTLTTDENGREFEDNPVPLSDTADPAFLEFTQQFSATVVTERDALVSEKQSLIAERDSLTTENQSLVTERDALTAEKQSLVTERDALTAEKSAIVVELQAANQKIATMSGHPDVIAAKRATDIATAKQQQIDGANLRKSAEAKLVALGEPVPTIPK